MIELFMVKVKKLRLINSIVDQIKTLKFEKTSRLSNSK
ncbi:hypothetical protein C427_3318 [Paraglaciecola psychrophila 170]|uniref:Uncharacterized protein n=1 Tax=Paraglaciecola psychrophila 170 TaxID=1129794 RepID=K7A6Z0_9ALTE|nr:hypothetical protein C427_3318 [Paraglaciecola psychrophila 170]GAC38097.1 hypothetical protein GPSY_2481 [Paraglaciecola psychrophila 170]